MHVVVEEQDQIAAGGADPGVAGTAGTPVLAQADQADGRKLAFDQLEAAVARSVIDQYDLLEVAGLSDRRPAATREDTPRHCS